MRPFPHNRNHINEEQCKLLASYINGTLNYSNFVTPQELDEVWNSPTGIWVFRDGRWSLSWKNDYELLIISIGAHRPLCRVTLSHDGGEPYIAYEMGQSDRAKELFEKERLAERIRGSEHGDILDV